VGSLDLSSSSGSEDEGEEHLHHASVAGVLEETEEHDQEYTIYDHVPLRRESSQFSISGISTLKIFKLFGFFFCFKGTIRPDWIYMRVVSLYRP
jgi:hypothetical protein